MLEVDFVYGFMKVTWIGEWLADGKWYNTIEEAQERKEYLKQFRIDGYIVSAQIGEIKRVDG